MLIRGGRGEEVSLPGKRRPESAVECLDVVIANHVEGSEEFLLEVRLHAAGVLHYRVNTEVRPELLHTPSYQRHCIEVTAAVTA